jgi:predicted transposase YbfD/YdcC
LQSSQYEDRVRSASSFTQSLESILMTTKFAMTRSQNTDKSREENEIFTYLAESCEQFFESILETWRKLQSRFLVLTQMIKNILSIFVFDVEVERLFSMTKDVVTYRRNRFHEEIIENIMIFKKMLSLKKINRNQHVSLIVFNILMNDEMSKKLLNESTEWIDENDEFVDIDDVHDQTDVDSTSNDANASSQLIANTDFSTSFDFDLSKISSLAFDSANSSLSTYFEFHRETFSQIRRKGERRKASTQYEEKNSSKRRKWWEINMNNDLFWTIIYINYIFHVFILIRCTSYIYQLYLLIYMTRRRIKSIFETN